jgi:hypothetical protein
MVEEEVGFIVEVQRQLERLLFQELLGVLVAEVVETITLHQMVVEQLMHIQDLE